MSSLRLVAMLLIAAGIVGLMCGCITYTKMPNGVWVGRFELSIRNQDAINAPVWAGIGSVAIGAVLLAVGLKT